jgi:hypothetical protein
MNDFLKSLRTKEKQRYERNNRKPYNNQYNGNQYNGNPQYKGNEGNFKKGPGYRSEETDKLMTALGQTVPEIKIVLENIAENQHRLAEAEERRAGAEERKAGAFEALAESLQALLTNGIQLPLNPGIPYTTSSSPVEAEKPIRSSAADRENVLDTIFGMRDQGATYTEIASHLDSESIPTFSGKGKWHAQTIHRLCQERK